MSKDGIDASASLWSAVLLSFMYCPAFLCPSGCTERLRACAVTRITGQSQHVISSPRIESYSVWNTERFEWKSPEVQARLAFKVSGRWHYVGSHSLVIIWTLSTLSGYCASRLSSVLRVCLPLFPMLSTSQDRLGFIKTCHLDESSHNTMALMCLHQIKLKARCSDPHIPDVTKSTLSCFRCLLYLQLVPDKQVNSESQAELAATSTK